MRCLFLDRDGTLCVDKNYSNKLNDLEIIGEKELRYNLHALRSLGFYVVVISNQAGVSLGHTTESEVTAFNAELNRRLGYAIDDFFFCPHGKNDGCSCRKPNVGLVERAIRKYRITPEQSWFIGDKTTDVETGKNAGARTVLVLTGRGKHELHASDPDLVAEDINQALSIIYRISIREIKPICGNAGKIRLTGVVDKRLTGRFSKLFEKIEVDGKTEDGFTIEPTLPVDFIIGRQ